MAGTGDGHIAEAGIKQVWMDARVGMNEDALGGESLGTVTGDRIAMVEVAMFIGIELDLAIVVEPRINAAVGTNCFDDCEVTIGDTERLVRCGELDTVANGKVTCHFTVDADACKSARVIGRKFARRFFNGK